MPSVSAIILTRDSRRTIEACIQAIKPAVDHVIVVDTGSTDDTVQIAKDNGAYVYRFEWCDDFAAARNFGDSLATTDWVIHVDSDEILREEDLGKVRKLCAKYKKTTAPVIFGLQILSVMATKLEVGVAPRIYKRGVFAWRGIIHEQPYTRRKEVFDYIPSDIGAFHDGYNANVVNFRDKICTRNIPLLKKAIDQEPHNASYHYFLGRDYKTLKEYGAAIPHLRCAIELGEQLNSRIVEDAHRLLTLCLETIEAPTRS
jgi:glycosyltransferase involved in cell wall biosynthesis